MSIGQWKLWPAESQAALSPVSATVSSFLKWTRGKHLLLVVLRRAEHTVPEVALGHNEPSATAAVDQLCRRPSRINLFS